MPSKVDFAAAGFDAGTATARIASAASVGAAKRIDDWIGELSKDDPIVTFCVYGFHVGCQTAIALRDKGFDAKYMTGGHSGWRAKKGAMKLVES